MEQLAKIYKHIGAFSKLCKLAYPWVYSGQSVSESYCVKETDAEWSSREV